MGCGQSKIGNLYPKNKKNKNGSKRNGFSIRSSSIEQKNGNGNNKGNKTNNNAAELNRNEEQNGALDKNQAKKKPIVPVGGPLLQQTEISTSQLDFFRMLDEKIENGPDYDESADSPLQADHVSGLLRRWELASVSWSNVNELNSNNSFRHQSSPQPSRVLAGVQQQHQQQLVQRPAYKSLPPPISGLGISKSGSGDGDSSSSVGSCGPLSQLSAKDREGMRNIVGGRPESAPVYVQRMSSAARVDGLQDVVHHPYHCPSPSMPRHVLESISQSPTQSLKTPPGISSPTAVSRYQQHYHQLELQQAPQQQSLKLAKVQYNGEYTPLIQQPSAYRDYRQQQQQQPYDSPGPHALIRNSPSNPYIQQFHISSASPQTLAQPQQQQQQQSQLKKRVGASYSASAQMT